VFNCKIMKFILGKKIGMTQLFNEDGEAVPVTLIEAGPCKVTRVKGKNEDGYDAVQIGFSALKKVKKSQRRSPFRYVREVPGVFDVSENDEILVDVFSPGEKVNISATSKGKGFAGVMKRWNFKGAATSSHGTKKTNRKPGSIGSMYPQRVFKGKKMAGRMGADKVTTKNLEVVNVDKEKNVIAVKGALPGKIGGMVIVRGL